MLKEAYPCSSNVFHSVWLVSAIKAHQYNKIGVAIFTRHIPILLKPHALVTLTNTGIINSY